MRVDSRHVSSIWKYQGDKLVDESGYTLAWVEAEGRYYSEHRLVVEAALGRRLKTEEEVHHVNGNRSDNRRGNLVVCDPKYHDYLDAVMRLRKHKTYSLRWQLKQIRTINAFFRWGVKLSSAHKKIQKRIEAYTSQRGFGRGTRK